MRRLVFLRKPAKLVLITALMTLLSTAMLIFALQSSLDETVMEHSMNTTAYVGSLYSRLQQYPMLKALPAEVLQQLERADTVEEVMITSAYSAKAEGLTYMPDGFGNKESLDKKLFVEGTVSDEPDLAPDSLGMMETFHMEITELWGGNWNGKGIAVHILHDGNVTEPQMKKGDHLFLVGRYSNNAAGDVNGMIIIDPELLASLGEETDSAIWAHPILILQQELDEEASEAAIDAFLQKTGLDAPLMQMREIRDMVTVYPVKDMSMLLTVADGTTFLTMGRELSAEDTGKRVCVVQEALARQNGLTVGDTIRLSIAESGYVYDSSDAEEFLGQRNGYPFEGDAQLEYEAYGEFEIIGLYSEINRNTVGADYFHHTRNDVFLPDGILPKPTAEAQANGVTFRVLGPDYEEFMDTFEVPLNEQGYTLNLVDTGWESVSGSFFAMSDRRAVLTACALVAFLAAVVSFDILLTNHFRYEYALRRLLGARPREARGIYVAGFLTTAIPAGLLAAISSFGAYLLWLKKPFSAALSAPPPADLAILAELAIETAAELAAAFVLLMGMARMLRRQSLIRLLK